MSRAVAPRLLDIRITDPADVWNWYQFQRQLLDEEAVRVRTLFQGSRVAPDPGWARYFGRTIDEIEALLAEQRKELDFLAMLGMLRQPKADCKATSRHASDSGRRMGFHGGSETRGSAPSGVESGSNSNQIFWMSGATMDRSQRPRKRLLFSKLHSSCVTGSRMDDTGLRSSDATMTHKTCIPFALISYRLLDCEVAQER